jgi:1,4-dihydroxy-2-naphthoate octaprenyltransferase
MSASVLPPLLRAEEALRQLPMPPIAFAAIAFGLFLAGLGVLWSFRNTANKVGDRHKSADAGHP